MFSTIISSRAPQVVTAYLHERITNGETVGVIDFHQVGALIPRDQRYQIFRWTGTPPVGINPLSLAKEELPDYIVFQKKSRAEFVEPYADVLTEQYREEKVFADSFFIYKRK